MTKAEAVVYVQSQVACAMIEAEGMKAENANRERRGEAPAYVHDHFAALIDRYGISHNGVLGILMEAY